MTDQEAYSRSDLHDQLDALLDRADHSGGQLDPSDLFQFVAAIAYGRGVAEAYHQDAMQEVNQLKQRGIETPDGFEQRQKRVYALGVLYRVLSDLNGAEAAGDGRGCLLPSQFALGAVVSDISSALHHAGAKPGKKPNGPLIFQNPTTGDREMRHDARTQIVQALQYREALDKRCITVMQRDLEPPLADKTYQYWLKKAGGAKGHAVQEARKAAREGGATARWTKPLNSEELRRTYALARGLPVDDLGD